MPAQRNSRVITFSLPPEMAEQLEEVVKEEGRSMSEFLREAIRQHLEEREWLRLLRYERMREREAKQEEESHGVP